ncbi:MAG: hypothetical protein Q7R65_03330 [bacterium]|nr:hypothetical protein [bacterium]
MIFFQSKEFAVIYLQFTRYFAIVAKLLRHCSVDVNYRLLGYKNTIENSMRMRLGLPVNARIPWSTALYDEEIARFNQFCDWTDNILHFEQCRSPQAPVVSVSTVLSTLTKKLPETKQLSDVHLQFMRDVIDLDSSLTLTLTEEGLKTTDEGIMFPLSLDYEFAFIIDQMDKLGVRLGN